MCSFKEIEAADTIAVSVQASGLSILLACETLVSAPLVDFLGVSESGAEDLNGTG